MSRVVVLQMAMGSYRQGFLDRLTESGVPIEFRVGDVHFGTALRTGVSSPIVNPTRDNVFFLGRRLGFQPVNPLALVSPTVVVIETNPRNLTSWTVALIRRVIGKKTFGWGHSLSRDGKTRGLNYRVRRMLKNLCSGLIAYTESEAANERSMFPGKEVVVATNALYSASEMVPTHCPRSNIVWIGRLVEEKKPALALRAFALARDDLPSDTEMNVVGDGPLRAEIERLRRQLGLEDKVKIVGSITDRDELKALFATSYALLATGYIGLNAIQSIGFGVPVLYPVAELHAPEIEALDRTNSRTFDADDAGSCARAMVLMSQQRERDGLTQHDRIAEGARARYSTESMAEPFMRLAKGDL